MSERQGDASPFEPAGLAFTPVSSGLIKVRLIGVAVWLGLPLLGVVVLAILFPGWWWAIPGGVLAALIMWLCWLIPRQVRSIGYAERDEDLFIRKGIVFRQLTVVPYGQIGRASCRERVEGEGVEGVVSNVIVSGIGVVCAEVR